MAETETQIINIDSRFRVDPGGSTSTDFIVNLPSPLRNVKSIRLSSIEIPNVFYAFNNEPSTIFQVRKGFNPTTDVSSYVHQEWSTILIDPGNYSAAKLQVNLQEDIGIALGFSQTASNRDNHGFQYTIDENTGHSRFFLKTSSSDYIFNISNGNAKETFDINLSPVDLNQVYEYALADGAFDGVSNEGKFIREIDIYAQALNHYATSLVIGDINMRDILGFSDFLYYAKNSYQSTGFINTTGFQYILLDINGYDTITHISQDNEFKIFAKIPLTVSKNFITIGNITSINTRPKLFDTPENIPQIRVRIMDILGNILDLNKQNISMTFEVEYFRTQKAYDKARNTLLPEGELTSFSAAGTRTTAQVEKKERLRNIVFKQ